MPLISSPHTALYALLLTACIYDVKERRVPQLLNGLLLLGGLLYQVAQGGVSGSLEALLGALMALALLIVPFALYVYRGGDVKLCMGVGAWLGWEDALWCVAYGVLIGGLIGVGALALRRLTLDAGEPAPPSTVPMAVAFSLSTLYFTWGA